MKLYAGLDWGAYEHAVCVVDDNGKVHKQFVVKHDVDGLVELVRKLGAVSDEKVSIAVERPNGLLIDTLVDAGHAIVPMHPNAVAACRPRYRAAVGKSDPGDAYIIADMLRTDGHRFRVLKPMSDETRALRAQVRMRDDLVVTRVKIANQLRELLDTFWPGAKEIFAAVDSAIGLAFLEKFPTPSAAKRLGEKRLGAFLAKNKYSGHRSPAVLLERLHAAPVGLVGSAEAAAKGEIVLSLVAVLKPLVAELARMGAAIEAAVADVPVGRIVQSLPRSGGVNAAQIAVELGDDPNRFATADQLAAEAGMAPVTHSSGKSRGVSFRHACNKRLRRALVSFAHNSTLSSAWAANVYQRARDRGCRHPQAIRILGRAWCRILWRCWHDNVPYDPARHGALMRAAA